MTNTVTTGAAINILVNSSIEELYPDMEVHPETSAYILTFVTPFINVLDTVTDIDSIIGWIPMSFSGEFGKQALILTEHMKRTNATVDEIKTAFYKIIVKIIIQQSGAYVMGREGDNVILPWDVQNILGAGAEDGDDLFSVLGVHPGDETLPVSININGNLFTHMLTCEFTYGLLLFSKISGHQPNIRMFG